MNKKITPPPRLSSEQVSFWLLLMLFILIDRLRQDAAARTFI